MIRIEYTTAHKADPAYHSKLPAIVVTHLVEKKVLVSLIEAFINSAGVSEFRDALEKAGILVAGTPEDTGNGGYYISVDGGHAPKVNHTLQVDAMQEAERLAKKTPGTMVRVLKQVGYRKATQTVTLEGEPK